MVLGSLTCSLDINTHYFSEVYNLIEDLFKNEITNLLETAISNEVVNTIQSSFSTALSSFAYQLPISNDMVLDLSLVSNPTFNPSYITMNLKGTNCDN
jgi:RNase adaptor protein for sRNA GlmZ degradation